MSLKYILLFCVSGCRYSTTASPGSNAVVNNTLITILSTRTAILDVLQIYIYFTNLDGWHVKHLKGYTKHYLPIWNLVSEPQALVCQNVTCNTARWHNKVLQYVFWISIIFELFPLLHNPPKDFKDQVNQHTVCQTGCICFILQFPFTVFRYGRH